MFLVSPYSLLVVHGDTCTLLTLQIQRNLATDGNIEEMQKVALVSDSKAKVGASLGYNVRTLLKDLGLEVCFPPLAPISSGPCC